MKQILLLIIVLAVGFGGVFVLSKNLESIKPKPDASRADEDLYFSPAQLAAVGHDFRGLIADWYWINSLQYVGGKLVENEGRVNINDLKPLNPRLLYPMLDTASTLDPKFTTVYTYGASVLPAIDNEQAVKLVQKGIAENPDNWHLYHNLGYIYWQMKDYKNASEAYAQGASKPNAPVWMKQMSANMTAQGGSREFAMQVYKQMFDSAEDEQTKTFAELRYYQVVSELRIEAVNNFLQNFKTKNNRCPDSIREIIPLLKNSSVTDFQIDKSGNLIDPTGVPYLFDKPACTAKLNPDSKIPKF